MKKFYFVLAMVAVAVASCQKDVVYHDTPEQNQSVELAYSNTRSYDEALEIAEGALKLLDGDDTRSTTKRVIKRGEGQTVMRPVTRGGEVNDEPIMYVFNNEDNQGFTIVAADRSQQPIIAVTEYGSYTYGEPTGVEPFDLLMEDMVTTLSVLPEEPMAIIVTKENYVERVKYGPLTNVQWGTDTIYGAMYPDGIAYDEAAAIAQALMCSLSDGSYVVTNPNDVLYGQTIALDVATMSNHMRNDIHGVGANVCTSDVHDMIARLYLEIGYRLSEGTNISLTNKLSSFQLSKVHSVLDGFGVTVGNIQSHDEYHMHALANPIIVIRPDFNISVFRGVLNGLLSKNTLTWISVGYCFYRYDEVVSTLNYLINPNHPDPYGYTETERTQKYDAMYYMNWGYDGYSNGWFAAGCFDMSQRITDGISTPLGGWTPELNYNYVNVQMFEIHNPYGSIIY